MSGMMILSSGRKNRSVAAAQRPVLGRRTADHDRLEQRAAPHRHAVDGQRGERFLRRVEAGVVAERALGQHLARLQPALQDHLGLGRDLERDRLAVDHLDPLALEEPGEQVLVHVPGERRCGGVGDGGRAAEGDGDRQPLPALGGQLVVVVAVLVDLPVHADGALVVALEAVEPEVAHAVDGALGVGQAQVEEGAAVLGPGEEGREPVQVDLVALEHDLLDGRVLHLLRRDVRDRAELAEGVPHPHEALRQLRLEQRADLLGDLVEGLQPERLEQPPVGAEDVHRQRHVRALDVLEEQRRAAGLVDAVDDLPDLQVRIDFGLDALEVAIALQGAEERAKIVVSHAVQYPAPANLGR